MFINRLANNFFYKSRQFGWSIYGYYAWDNNSKKTSQLENEIVNKLLEYKKSENEYILDAGCGTGNYAIKIYNAGFNVVGVDYAKGMICKANKKILNNNSNSIQFHCISLTTKLPYDDNFFDNIIMISVLQAVPRPIYTLNELKRVLKPGGKIILVHFPKSEYHKMSLHTEVKLKLEKSYKHHLVSKGLLYLKSYIERKGATKYWTYDELKKLVLQTKMTILESENNSPIILTVQK